MLEWTKTIVIHKLYHGNCINNTLRPRQSCRHFTDNTFKGLFDINFLIYIEISLKFVLKGPFNNIPALF